MMTKMMMMMIMMMTIMMMLMDMMVTMMFTRKRHSRLASLLIIPESQLLNKLLPSY